jgi:hypothetical protein
MEEAVCLLHKPHIRRWPVAEYDGCTAVFDISRKCCALHDIDLWYAETDEEVKRAHHNFRFCIRANARTDEWYVRWQWWLLSWIFWAGVMTFGGRIWRYRRLAWDRAR